MPFDYNPDTDIPDLSGKSIFITGGRMQIQKSLYLIPTNLTNPGTGGLGAEAALHLAKHNPAHIYISGRNAKNGEKVTK